MENPLTAYETGELRKRRSAKWRYYEPDVLPMWVAEMDTPPAEPIRRVLAAAVENGDLGYPYLDGLPAAFSGFAAERYGWRVDPSVPLLAPDVMRGVAEVLRCVTGPGDGVVVNTPVYPPFFHVIAETGRQVVESPLARGADGEYALDLDRLARDFAAGARAYLLCSPHNPTGLVPTRPELAAIAELADRYGVRVLADEIHAPLTYRGVTHTPFLTLDAEAASRAVAFVSASKGWNLAGLKAALVVPGAAARAEVEQVSLGLMYGSGHLGVLAAEAAFSDGGEWLDALRAGLDHNRRLLGELLAEYLPEVRYRPPAATFLAWLDCRALDLGPDPSVAFLEKGRVAVNAGPTFGPPGAGHVRLNFATSPERVHEAVRRMAAAVGR